MIAELDNYWERIEDLHNQISGLLEDLPAEALNWRPIQGEENHVTNSLAVLTAHLVGAEHFWIAETLGGWASTRDRDAEFAIRVTSTAELIQRLEKVAVETREVFSNLSEADLNDTRQVQGRTVPVRWCILHVIDHTALHLGHMQITYQLWTGGKSARSPFWFDRLSRKKYL
jgi:uncharacterized damage-inducible protein DinB